MRLRGRELPERHLAAEIVQGEEDLAPEENLPEKDGEDCSEDGEDPPRYPVVPAPERGGEECPQKPDPEAGQEVHGSPVGHAGGV